MNLPEPPTTDTTPIEYLLESAGRMGKASVIKSGVFIEPEFIGRIPLFFAPLYQIFAGSAEVWIDA
jgi:hypothetical protein